MRLDQLTQAVADCISEVAEHGGAKEIYLPSKPLYRIRKVGDRVELQNLDADGGSETTWLTHIEAERFVEMSRELSLLVAQGDTTED